MFVLKKDSPIVKAWVSAVLTGTYTIDQVPTIFGLRAAVQAVLDEMTESKEEDGE